MSCDIESISVFMDYSKIVFKVLNPNQDWLAAWDVVTYVDETHLLFPYLQELMRLKSVEARLQSASIHRDKITFTVLHHDQG